MDTRKFYDIALCVLLSRCRNTAHQEHLTPCP
jgi:hypothetical protein